MESKWTACIQTRSVFNTVNSCILCGKLFANVVCDSVVKWFRSFLSNRSLSLKHNSFTSESHTSRVSVAQESSCGPLAFIIYKNYLLSVTKFSKVICYADDLKIYAIVKSCEDARK